MVRPVPLIEKAAEGHHVVKKQIQSSPNRQETSGHLRMTLGLGLLPDFAISYHNRGTILAQVGWSG